MEKKITSLLVRPNSPAEVVEIDDIRKAIGSEKIQANGHAVPEGSFNAYYDPDAQAKGKPFNRTFYEIEYYGTMVINGMNEQDRSLRPSEIQFILALLNGANGYKDMHGKIITAGMTLRMEDGTFEKVYATVNAYGEPDLGINASNEDYLARHGLGEMDREFYSLCNFDLTKAEITA